MVLNYLRRSTKETFVIQFFSCGRIGNIAEQVDRDTSPAGNVALICDKESSNIWTWITGNREPRCGISLKSHRPLHDCSVLREAVSPIGQNATTFSLIWHETSSLRISRNPGRLFFLYLCGPMRQLDMGIPGKTFPMKTAWEV